MTILSLRRVLHLRQIVPSSFLIYSTLSIFLSRLCFLMPPVIAPHRAFTQPVSAMCKNGLQALCRHFGLDDDGPVATLRQLLKTHLRNNRAQLADNPIYVRLYPRHRRRQQNLQPANEPDEDHPDNDQDRDSQRNRSPSLNPSIDGEWHGIQQPNIDIDAVNPPSLPSRHPSTNPATTPLLRSPEPEEPPFSQPEQERHPSSYFSTYTFSFPCYITSFLLHIYIEAS